MPHEEPISSTGARLATGAMAIASPGGAEIGVLGVVRAAYRRSRTWSAQASFVATLRPARLELPEGVVALDVLGGEGTLRADLRPRLRGRVTPFGALGVALLRARARASDAIPPNRGATEAAWTASRSLRAGVAIRLATSLALELESFVAVPVPTPRVNVAGEPRTSWGAPWMGVGVLIAWTR